VILAQPSKLRTYGYFDLEAAISDKDADGKRGSFDQHHFNLISVFALDQHFWIFSEIEWEHGPSIGEEQSSGNVVLERSWLEYRKSESLKIKFGKFLSPFGIYNLKHDATPTYLSVFLPNSIYGKHKNTVGNDQRLYAKFGGGIQLFGAMYINSWETNYYFYFINGRGPSPYEKDNNADKGIGGRIIISPPINCLMMGGSYYTDLNGNADNTRQTTTAFDVTYDRSNLLIEAEYFIPQLETVDGDTVPAGKFRTGRGYYLQVAYTYLDRISPFARYGFYQSDLDIAGNDEKHFVTGLNYAFTSKVYLKSEIHFVNIEGLENDRYKMAAFSMVVAF